jgi:REP element-mobilizing transposase RayT
MMRGVNKQLIFKDIEDYAKYTEALRNYKAICKFELHAYCIMPNHIHLLIEEGDIKIPNILQRIGAHYVYWYNKKYSRVGHLFQGRYRSEAVEDELYLKTVIRYIHQNPVKAGIVSRCEDYEWSSYPKIRTRGQTPMCEHWGLTPLISKLFSNDNSKVLERFIKFHEKLETKKCLDIDNIENRLTDKEASEIIKELCKINNCRELNQGNKNTRYKIVKELLKLGLSMRQIIRITGISRINIGELLH